MKIFNDFLTHLFIRIQETMENVKKCKNFLSTLIKLASSGKQSTEATANVKELVQNLLVRSLRVSLHAGVRSTRQLCLLLGVPGALQHPVCRASTLTSPVFWRGT